MGDLQAGAISFMNEWWVCYPRAAEGESRAGAYAFGRVVRDGREGDVEVEDLVVVDVEEPGDALNAAELEGAADLRLLSLLQRVIVVGRRVFAARHRHKAAKLVRIQKLEQLWRVLDMDKNVAHSEGFVVAQPPVEAVRLASHQSDREARASVVVREARVGGFRRLRDRLCDRVVCSRLALF